MKRVGEKTSEKIDCLGVQKPGKVVYVHPSSGAIFGSLTLVTSLILSSS